MPSTEYLGDARILSVCELGVIRETAIPLAGWDKDCSLSDRSRPQALRSCPSFHEPTSLGLLASGWSVHTTCVRSRVGGAGTLRVLIDHHITVARRTAVAQGNHRLDHPRRRCIEDRLYVLPLDLFILSIGMSCLHV